MVYFPIYDGATQCLGSKSDPRNPNNDWFVSGNLGAYPPTGALTRPAAGATVAGGTSPSIDVSANASDDVRVTAVRLVARINGQWMEIGPKVSQPASPGFYDWDVDLCAAGPFNGPLELALRVWDHEGNVAAALAPRTIQVDHACPPPSSQLEPAEVFASTALRLNWEASSSGAGLGGFELQWTTSPGSWKPADTISLPGGLRSTWFGGQPGSTVYFRLRALDSNGQAEAWPASAETSAALPTGCTPDGFEPDDTPDQARDLALGEWALGSLCGSSDPAGNPDWFWVQIDQPEKYFVGMSSQSGGAAVKITVYGGDGSTVLASGGSSGIGQGAGVRFQAETAGGYYIKVEPLTPNLFGTDAVYRIVAAQLREIFMPVMAR